MRYNLLCHKLCCVCMLCKVLARVLCVFLLTYLFCPPAYCNGLINLKAISQVESSGRPHVIGDRHLKHHAYGLYQIRLPLIQDYNKAHKTHYTEQDMLDPKKAEKVALWAFNTYYPAFLKRNGKEINEIALLTCWNMGQGNFLKGKRAINYQAKYNKAKRRAL